MFTVLSNTRNANLYIATALGIMIVVLLTFAVVPSIAAPKPVSVPATGNSTAYSEFLSGEKVLYGNPARLSEALAAYHQGEKAVSINDVEWNSALSTYHLGEKADYTNAVNAGSALAAYLAGEKTIYTNPADTAISVWSFGEKAILPFDVVEQALWTHRMGEKGPK